jgi:hypothetical protein
METPVRVSTANYPRSSLSFRSAGLEQDIHFTAHLGLVVIEERRPVVVAQ